MADTETLNAWRRREVQMIGAAISTRSWQDVEIAYNQLRDKMDAELIRSARLVAADAKPELVIDEQYVIDKLRDGCNRTANQERVIVRNYGDHRASTATRERDAAEALLDEIADEYARGRGPYAWDHIAAILAKRQSPATPAALVVTDDDGEFNGHNQ